MLNKFRAFFLSLTIVSIMMFSVFGTTIVYADDGTTTESTETSAPPTSSDEAVTSDPVEGTAQPEESVTPEATAQPEDHVAVTEETPPTEEAVATEATPQPEEAAVEVSPVPTLEQLPDNTTVTVINSDGEAQPLATQDSADAITSATDPIWCPATQSTPTPGENGCTPSKISFSELLNLLDTDSTYSGAGTIYIEQGPYMGPESSINFNDYTLANIKNYDLTVYGGWDGNKNGNTNGTSQFNIPIIVGSSGNPWIGSLTFNNLVISGVNNDTGLTAYSNGDITLSNVTVKDSQAGADLNAVRRVTVKDSKFNNNKTAGANIKSGDLVITASKPDDYSEFNGNGYGLTVESQNSVTLNQVLANENGFYGADITAGGSVEIYNSAFSGNVSYNHGYGLKVVTPGYIYAEGLKADDNYEFGASLDSGSWVEIYGSSNNADYETNTFNGNGYGLKVVATDEVTLENIEANQNKLYGANITSSSFVDISNSFFDGNKSYTYSCKQKTSCLSCEPTSTYEGYGLQVVSNDSIYLTDVSASGNNLFGAYLDGNYVDIFGGFFNNNGNDSGKTLTGSGVEIISDTNVNISEIEANNNQLFGANIQAVRDVTISYGFFNGNKAYTAGGYGLQVVTGRFVTITEIEASDNYSFGAQLTGDNVAIAFGDFNNNGSDSLLHPTGSGLEIQSTGDVALIFINANDNQLFGANVQAVGSVAIDESFFNGNMAYAYTCKHSTSCLSCESTYEGYGLQVVTSADITVSDVTADKNYLFGAYLEGTEIYVSYGSFSNNGTGNPSDHVGKGLEVVSTGDNNGVSLYQVNASNNQLFGANIQAESDVLIETSVFSGNLSYTAGKSGKTYDGYGLKVVTMNDISLDEVTANENGLYGAHLEGVNVDIETGFFNNNGSGDPSNPTGKGLEVVSTGEVTLNNVEANNNQLFGANIQTDGNVTITNSFFSNNMFYTSGKCKSTAYDGYGLKVVSTNGNIELAQVTANENGLYGASLDGTLEIKVSDSTFNDNITSSGLIITGGDVILDNVTASNNGADGATICQANSVLVTNSMFEDNSEFGLKVASPTFNDPDGLLNTYSGNGSGSVFYDPVTCAATTGGGSNNGNNSHHDNGNDSHHDNWWKGHDGKNYHGHKHGHSYYGGASYKSCHSFCHSLSKHNNEKSNHGHEFGHSYYGGSSHKSCHSFYKSDKK